MLCKLFPLVVILQVIIQRSHGKAVKNIPCGRGCAVAESISSEERQQARFQVCYSQLAPSGQVYDRETKACYNFLEEGPCGRGKLLARSMSSFNTVICLPNCNKEKAKSKAEWHPKWRNGKCALPNTELEDIYDDDATEDPENASKSEVHDGDNDDDDDYSNKSK